MEFAKVSSFWNVLRSFNINNVIEKCRTFLKEVKTWWWLMNQTMTLKHRPWMHLRGEERDMEREEHNVATKLVCFNNGE
jgi:hypothetical protein